MDPIFLIVAVGIICLLAGFGLSLSFHRRTIRRLRTKLRTTELKAPKKEINTSNVVLLIVGIFLLAFILTMITVFCVFGSVPDTLIQYTMGAGGVEAVMLAAIKISKVVKTEKKSSGSEKPDDTIEERNDLE